MLPRDVCFRSASLPPHYCDGLFLRRTSLLEDRVRTLPAITFADAMIDRRWYRSNAVGKRVAQNVVKTTGKICWQEL